MNPVRLNMTLAVNSPALLHFSPYLIHSRTRSLIVAEEPRLRRGHNGYE